MNIKRLFKICCSLLLALTIILIWFIFVPPITTRAASFTVCPTGPPSCDYSSIQSAVDAADDGDVIKVAAGTYTGINNKGGHDQVVYLDKGVTIRGGYTTSNWTTSDPIANPTTLDAQGGGRLLYITGNISPTIEGLRLTGGNSSGFGGWGSFDAGGGIFIRGSDATFRNNTLFSNTATTGGGLFLDNSQASLNNNTISSNIADVGGGLFLWESAANIFDNIISNNTGGGVDMHFSPATISSNTISGNTSDYPEGGGVNMYESHAILNGNTIASNNAVWGGGIHLTLSPAILTNNVVKSNKASGGGGGLFLNSSDATLTNNLIFDNQTDLFGSALAIYLSLPNLKHNTIAGNSGGDGSGINVSESTVTLTNTIITNHVVGVQVQSGSAASLESTLWGNGAWANGTDWVNDGTISTTSDLWGNPDFVDPNAGDYHIGSNSDAIDQGVDAGVTTDIDYHPRPYQAPDIGADEYWPPGALKFVYLPIALHR